MVHEEQGFVEPVRQVVPRHTTQNRAGRCRGQAGREGNNGKIILEKEKLIDLLFSNNERLMSELAGLRQEIERQNIEIRQVNEASARWEQRTMAAEKRA